MLVLTRTVIATLVSGSVVAGQGIAGAPVPRVPPPEEERALALEAAPEELRAGAGVWLLTRAGFVHDRETTNGYTCIVNRDEVLALKPTCFDVEGTATVLPAIVRFGNLLMEGMPVPQIRKDIENGFKDGRFVSPRRAGIAFMMSPRIVNVLDAAAGTVGTAPPHYMIYAPNVSQSDLRLPMSVYNAHPWLPYAAYTGPHGFIIVSIPDSSGAMKQHRAMHHTAGQGKARQ